MGVEFVKRNISRGYSGWVEIDNDKFYCRSSVEFIYLHHLSYKYKKLDGYNIKMENVIFEYNDEKYKPDFLIYHNNVLVKIIETKSDKNQIIRENKGNKYELFKYYFDKLKIDFEICYKDTEILTNDIKEKLDKWKHNLTQSISDENNPMFGMRHSVESKAKIGLKTKERCENPEYLSFLKSKLKKTDIQKQNCSISAIKRQNRIKYEKYGEIISKKCIICGCEFKDYEKKSKQTCKNSCTFRLRYSKGEIKCGGDGFKSFKTKIINSLKKYNYDISNMDNYGQFKIYINNIKELGLLPKTFGLNENTINKYFGNFEILKKELKNENNKN